MLMRPATKAGSWYSEDKDELNEQLGGWLSSAASSDTLQPQTLQPVRAIIGPHAGYSYSGRTAGFAYASIDPSRYKRVFLLGPSHYVAMESCAVSRVQKCETPLGYINVDTEVVQELIDSGEFDTMSVEADAQEHSLELHLPYLYKTFEGHAWKLVHVMVGRVPHERQAVFGRVFARYLDDPDNLFVISSDFCHWGRRFSFIDYDESCGEIHESISALDHRGMALIEALDADGFHAYIKQTKNTICGRVPIGILLQAVKHSTKQHSLKFVRYEQSSQCHTMRDSSVSYAAGVLSLVHAD